MNSGYSQSPHLLKGALVELTEPFLGPVPNVVVFQYNPETLTRELASSAEFAATGGNGAKSSKVATAAPYKPVETFNVTLELDAADDLERPDENPVAVASGVADRIAALEMLLHPLGDEGVVGQALATVAGALGDVVPRSEVPIVLFVWGPGMILPVRLTSFSVEEQAFSPTLYPIRAKVTVGLRVLNPDDLKKFGSQTSASRELAVKAWQFTHGQRELLARANVTNSVESILEMLPF